MAKLCKYSQWKYFLESRKCSKTPIGIPPYDHIRKQFGDFKWYCSGSSLSYAYSGLSNNGVLVSSPIESNNERSYLLLELTKPLTVGKTYQFDMDIIPMITSSSSNVYFDQIGVCFVDSLPNYTHGTVLSNLQLICPHLKTQLFLQSIKCQKLLLGMEKSILSWEYLFHMIL